jgi:hypothetical protein
MKVALSGMILGASMLSANAASLAGQATFTTPDGSTELYIDVTNGALTTNGVLNCITAHAQGTAKHSYSTDGLVDGSPTDAAVHDKNGVLAFFCGLEGLPEIVDDGNADREDQRVLVTFAGEKTCNRGTISAGATTGSWSGERVATQTVNPVVTFDCIMREDASIPAATAELSVKRIPAAIDEGIVDPDAGVQNVPMSRLNDYVFSGHAQVSFDLGADKPHSAYYTSDGQDGCSFITQPDGTVIADPCRGKIILKQDVATHNGEANGEDHIDVSSSLVGDWISDPDVVYYNVINRQDVAGSCSSGTYKNAAPSTEGAICDMRRGQDKGSQGLLTPFGCPYATGTPAGTKANVATCLAAGTTQVLNTCQDRASDSPCADADDCYDDEDTILLKNSYSIKAQFPDDPKTRYQTPSVQLVSKSQEYTKDTAQLRWSLVASGDLAGATDLKIHLDGSTEGIPVVRSADGTISFFAPAVDSTSVQLKGTVFTNCLSSTEDLGTAVPVTATERSTVESGSFSKTACARTFTFNAAGSQSYTVASAFAGVGTTVEVTFCPTNQPERDCLASTSRSATSTTNSRQAVIEGACEFVEDNHVGAFVRFNDGSRDAKVVCSAACTEHGMNGVTLDWEIDFEASVEDGAGKNKLMSPQAGANSAEVGASLIRKSFLSNSAQCGVDGKEFGADQTESACVLWSQGGAGDVTNGISTAEHIRAKLALCGSYLTQTLIVDFDGTADDLHFCNSKLLSLDVEQMTGEATDSTAVVASIQSPGASTIRTDFMSIGYEACAGGDYKLKGQIEVGAVVPLGFTEDSPDDNMWTVTLLGDRLVFESECENICAPLSPLDEVYKLDGKLDQTSACTECAKLELEIDLQVLGSPCAASDTLERGEVTLDLFAVAQTDPDCSGTAKQVASALDDKLCASLTPSGFGSSTLKVLSETLSHQSSDGSGAVVVVTDPFFTPASFTAGDGKQIGAASRNLNYADAFKTYTLTVYWEQDLGGGFRRLLRSSHVFGAGDHEAKSSIFILPASAQIQDAVESLDAGSEGAEEPASNTTDEPAEEEDAEEDAEAEGSGLSGGEIAVIIGGCVVGAIGIAYATVQVVRVNQQMGGGPQYSAVRRSERFSQVNF